MSSSQFNGENVDGVSSDLYRGKERNETGLKNIFVIFHCDEIFFAQKNDRRKIFCSLSIHPPPSIEMLLKMLMLSAERDHVLFSKPM